MRITKAVYYDPAIGPDRGTDVTSEASAQVTNGMLFYNGIYNFIFPDHFQGKIKKLKIDLEVAGKMFTRIYNENERINLPHDLGEINNKHASRVTDFVNLYGVFLS